MKLKVGACAFLCGQPAHKANPHNLIQSKTLPHKPITLTETMEGKIEGRVGGMLYTTPTNLTARGC